MTAILPLIFTTSWASGINGYAVVVILGLLGRFAGVHEVPPALQRTDVLIIATLLLACDVVADKIPYVDTLWDTVHTAIRPAIGGAVAGLIAGQAGSHQQLQIAVGAGLMTLLSHLIKAGLRVTVNASPEPVSNIVLSLAEDLTVATLVTVSMVWPWIAAAVALMLLLIGLVLVSLAWKTIRALLRRRARRRRSEADWTSQVSDAEPPR